MNEPIRRQGMKYIGTPVALWPNAIIYERDGVWYLVTGVIRTTDDEHTE